MNQLFEFDKIYKNVIGTDEAGRGPAAGGVFAAAVYFPEVTDSLILDLEKLNDSKKLSEKVRESLYDIIFGASINSIINIEVEETKTGKKLNVNINDIPKLFIAK